MKKPCLIVLSAVAAAAACTASAASGKRLVMGDVPPHTVGAYRPFTIPGEIAESDGLVELRRGREITVWCPERTASAKPRVLAAARRIVDSPFVPIGSISVGYVGNAEGEAVLKGLGVRYDSYGPRDVWNLDGKRAIALGPGAKGMFADPKLLDVLRKKLASHPVVALPGADLSLLPFGVEFGSAAAADGEAKVPDLPLFLGTGRDFGEFAAGARGVSLPVVAKGPAWMQATAPGCFAHIKNGNSSIVVFGVAPSAAPESVRPALIRVWCTMLANLNIETGCGAAGR